MSKQHLQKSTSLQREPANAQCLDVPSEITKAKQLSELQQNQNTLVRSQTPSAKETGPSLDSTKMDSVDGTLPPLPMSCHTDASVSGIKALVSKKKNQSSRRVGDMRSSKK